MGSEGDTDDSLHTPTHTTIWSFRYIPFLVPYKILLSTEIKPECIKMFRRFVVLVFVGW